LRSGIVLSCSICHKKLARIEADGKKEFGSRAGGSQ
jgi:hypothetical protein